MALHQFLQCAALLVLCYTHVTRAMAHEQQVHTQDDKVMHHLSNTMDEVHTMLSGKMPTVYDTEGCPSDGVLWNGCCYVMSTFKSCRKSADCYCKARGFDLVSIETKQENYMLMWMIQEHLHKIGAHKSYKPVAFWTSGVYTDDHKWMWNSTHEDVEYHGWAPQQPNALLTMKAAMCHKMQKMMMLKHYGGMMKKYNTRLHKRDTADIISYDDADFEHVITKRHADSHDSDGSSEENYGKHTYHSSEESDEDDEDWTGDEDEDDESYSDSEDDDSYDSDASDDNYNRRHHGKKHRHHRRHRGGRRHHGRRSYDSDDEKDSDYHHGQKKRSKGGYGMGYGMGGGMMKSMTKGMMKTKYGMKDDKKPYTMDEKHHDGKMMHHGSMMAMYKEKMKKLMSMDLSNAHLTIAYLNDTLAWYSMPHHNKLKNYFICEKHMDDKKTDAHYPNGDKHHEKQHEKHGDSPKAEPEAEPEPEHHQEAPATEMPEKH